MASRERRLPSPAAPSSAVTLSKAKEQHTCSGALLAWSTKPNLRPTRLPRSASRRCRRGLR